MSCVAIRKYSTKKHPVRPLTSGAPPPPPVSMLLMVAGERSMSVAQRSWTGTSHDFRRPNVRQWSESTTGAHKSLREKGQDTREKTLCCA
eukprot:CAMPEP_0206215006 /NCGR_PEP_ID=MMETSP0047_2-20121206/1966_1 /ASSEMBLY_ACC=CAM_ASM_000192 /TAXON_ID=195065 /ORGANISM="Chroomonas mesostigmatica_cf, Strain CCMP1168" /LENGTH=89 /DNA_ID=CAMNT_0053637275 /DNA_START=152 /DNA_END=421 /DNA_ORIENTATION=+